MDRGERAIKFIENLRHSKGEWAGKRLILEPWQKDFIHKLFGTVRPDGLRQYRNALLFIPRKNSKSTMAAAFSLYLLIGDAEPGAEVYSAANDKEQASLVFNEAASMIRQDPRLSRICKIVDSKKTIFYPATRSFFKALSKVPGTKHGFNASAIVIDEYHEAKSSELADTLETSMGSRRQPLMLTLTTAGVDKNTPCGRLYDHACKVRDKVIEDPTFLPVIYEAPADADPFDEQTWKIANPNYGVSVKPDYLREKILRARQLPTELNKVKRLHLNLWTKADDQWIRADKWKACAKPFDWEKLKGAKCWGGLDLASTTDFAAFALVFQWERGFVVLIWFWIPEETIVLREQKGSVPVNTWKQSGFLNSTEGNVIDYDVIRRDINALREIYDIQDIAVDRWNATQLINQLNGDGATMVPFGQGFGSMSGPTKELEKLIISENLIHQDNPCLNWMADNCVPETDAAGNVKLSKKKSKEKIDGMVATVMALGRAIASTGDAELYTGPLTL